MKTLAAILLLSFLVKVTICEDDQTMALSFLKKYGYISSSRSGNHDVATAIKRFQKFFHLSVTGKLDDSTVRLMKKPRCGIPDPNEDDPQSRWVTTWEKWSKYHLTYYVQPGEDLPHDQQRQIFADALKLWADVTLLTFSEVSSASNADIKISFGRNTHSGTSVEETCPYVFGVPGCCGGMAHGFSPEDGRAHFNEDETFTHGTSNGINLLWVAAHIFGHNLGMEHTTYEGAVMHPNYPGYVPNLHLHSDDVAGIQSLYGGVSICEREKHTISCPSGKIVHILQASYGRQDRGLCPSSDDTSNTNCHSANSHPIVAATCEFKNSCELFADNSVFGDPCPGTHKYLLVRHQCVNAFVRCEFTRGTLSCPGGKTILPLQASYGRHDRTTCPGSDMTDTNCHSEDTQMVVNYWCRDQTSCELYADNSVFGDPCPGTHKYLRVAYDCI